MSAAPAGLPAARRWASRLRSSPTLRIFSRPVFEPGNDRAVDVLVGVDDRRAPDVPVGDGEGVLRARAAVGDELGQHRGVGARVVAQECLDLRDGHRMRGVAALGGLSVGADRVASVVGVAEPGVFEDAAFRVLPLGLNLRVQTRPT
jgi:hypothetical protein